MRVLAGGPARETESELYRLHVAGLDAQSGYGVELVERQFGVTVRHRVVADDRGPRWHNEKIERVARVRQEFLDMTDPVDGDGFDALFMVDTDVILGPGVLERLWSVDAPVVYGVFWTKANWGNAPGVTRWPQVWDRHPYGFTQECWQALNQPGINEVPVYGGGACTLIRGRGLEARYWPLLEGLRHSGGIWPGEDRTFSLCCEVLGLEQVAVTGLPIVHCYTPDLQTPDALARIRQEVGL